MTKNNINDCVDSFTIISNSKVDMIVHLHQLLKKKIPTPYYHIDGHRYMGIGCKNSGYQKGTLFCSGDSHYSYGHNSYCDNHKVIKKYLIEKGGVDNILVD